MIGLASSSQRLPLFAVAPPGLEEITRAELFSLGINHPRVVPGGVEFEGFLTHLYRINLWSRTASRVLVRLGEFRALTFAELRRKAADLAWGSFLRAGQPVSIRATCHKSKLYHSDAVAERIAGAINNHFGQATENKPRRREDKANKNFAPFAPPVPLRGSRLENANPTGIVVRLDHDHCTVSLDSSGAHLHQRGYRRATAKAPLRETLAAALLMRAHYDPARPLLDPFCGAGTFAVEAALIARRIAPGRHRYFSFFDWVSFDAEGWRGLLDDADKSVIDSAPTIEASDRDKGAVSAAIANAGRAGVADAIHFRTCAVSAIEPASPPGLLISNLPYGRRLGDDVRNLYVQFGKVVRARCAHWRVAIIAGSTALAKATGLDFDESLMIENGGLRVPFVQTPALPRRGQIPQQERE